VDHNIAMPAQRSEAPAGVEAVLDRLPCGVVWLYDGGRIAGLNAAAGALLGADTVGRPIEALTGRGAEGLAGLVAGLEGEDRAVCRGVSVGSDGRVGRRPGGLPGCLGGERRARC